MHYQRVNVLLKQKVQLERIWLSIFMVKKKQIQKKVLINSKIGMQLLNQLLEVESRSHLHVKTTLLNTSLHEGRV